MFVSLWWLLFCTCVHLLPVRTSVSQALPFVCLSVCLSVDCLCGRFVCLSVHQYACLSVLCPSACLSVSLSIWLLVFAPSKRKKMLWQLEVVWLLFLRGRIFPPYTKTAFRICSSLAALSPPYTLQLWLICCVVVLDYTLCMLH